MNAVWNEAQVKGSELLLLLVLADYANDDETCWPSIDTLVKKSRMCKRNVQQTLRGLEDKKLISRVRDGGGRESTVYRIELAEFTGAYFAPVIQSAPVQYRSPVIPSAPQGCTIDHLRGDPQCTRSYIDPSIDPPRERSIQKESKSKPSPQLDGFDDFWTAYPRREAKAAAQRSWEKGKCSRFLSEILLSIQHQGAAGGTLARERQFIPLPSTWLNQRRWEDEVQPATPSSRFDPPGYKKPTQDEILAVMKEIAC